MKPYIALVLTFIQTFAVGQEFDKKTEVENIFNSLRKQNIITKKIANSPSWITSYQFEGDYSRERVFPNIPATATICVTPIAFESPIHDTLKKIDFSYDSAFYLKQIHDAIRALWSSQGLEFTTKLSFTKSGVLSKLRSEIGMISHPLFSKDGQTAVIIYGTINGNSVTKQPEKVYFLRKNDQEWTTIATIDSKKT
ncbi:MAG TPA: hypothetical protein VD884_11150 [Ohtaekwangia sp.]|nr:hypothetical protein [Ohtaekwangia sp.]